MQQYNASYAKPVNKPIPKQVVTERRQLEMSASNISNENKAATRKPQSFVVPAAPKLATKPAPQKPVERNLPLEIAKKHLTEQNRNIAQQQQQREEVQAVSYAKLHKPPPQEPLERRVPISNKQPPPPNQSAIKAKNFETADDTSYSKSFSKPLQKPTDDRPSSGAIKANTPQGSGLLTDSLSCIFTRRPQKNSQHKIPQKRVFFEEVPQRSHEQDEKEDPPSDTESTYLTEKKTKYETPEKQCPEPPVISQATPNITNEDWFATKQRILSSVNRDAPLKNICEPQPVAESKCPEAPQISVDPHGFDIEPPDHLNKNVSPYVPTNICEREEYNKYKTQQLKKEAAFILAQKRYKQGFEAPSMKNKCIQEVKKPPTSYLKDNTEKEITDPIPHKEVSNYEHYQRYENQAPPAQEETPAYEPIATITDAHQQTATYEPTQRYEPEPITHQNENIQEYEYHRGSYNANPYEEQGTSYETAPLDYQGQSAYYDQQTTYEHRSFNEPLHSQEMYASESSPSYGTVPQTNYEGQNELENMCPDAPHISEDSQMISDKPREDFENIPPDAPIISQVQDDNASSYYQAGTYGEYANFEDQSVFKEPLRVAASQGGNQKMCHRCSFQTTNAKKLRDHLKFVHGDTTTDLSPTGSQKSSEWFSRRDPKLPEEQSDLFSRRGPLKNDDLPPERNQQQQQQFQGRFKRRNTSALVNIISTDIVVPARNETGAGDNGGETGHEGEKAQVHSQDPGVLAAMEYFETTKDQPKKPRPYQRNQDDALENDWM